MMCNKDLVLALLVLSMPFHQAYGASLWSKSVQLEKAGQYSEAARVIQPLMDNSSERAPVYLRYAWLNYLQGHYNQAIASYKKVLELDSEYVDAHLGLTLTLQVKQRWREVDFHARKVLKKAPWDYAFRYIANLRLLIALEGQGKWHNLAQEALHMHGIYPSDVSSLVYLARAQAWMGKKSAARKAYSRVLKRAPNHIEASLYIINNPVDILSTIIY